MTDSWEWDDSLFRGSAPHYVRGRLPYSPDLVARLVEVLELDGRGRLLDVGCGPGVLSLMLAPWFAEVVGIDPDQEMLVEAERRARERQIEHAYWRQMRAEDLPGLGTFRVAVFGQSFHWVDRDRVGKTIFSKLEPGGAFVHVSDAHDDSPETSIHGNATPPFKAIQELVKTYLGPVRRAGQGTLPHGTADIDWSVLNTAGFVGPESFQLGADGEIDRDADDIVAWVWSRSGSAPHLFGDRLEQFEGDLRDLLRHASPLGRFAEQLPDTELLIWRTPGQ